MKTTDKEVVATLVKAGRKDLARAYLGEVKKSERPVTTAKTFTAKDLNAMPARTTIVLDDGTLWKHPKGHWVAENYWGGRAEPTLNEALEKVNKSRHQQVRSNHQSNVSPKRSAPGLTPSKSERPVTTAQPRAKVHDEAWDKIAAAWRKHEKNFLKVLDANESDVMQYPMMAQSNKKALATIRRAMKQIAKTISDNADAI